MTRLGRPYGLVPVGAVVNGPQRAAETAEDIGFPVAMKVADPEVVHKTDRGLVRVGMASADEVAATVRAFEQEVGRDGVPVLVQPVVDGVEIALGVARDPSFGPLVMVAAGESPRTCSTTVPSCSLRSPGRTGPRHPVPADLASARRLPGADPVDVGVAGAPPGLVGGPGRRRARDRRARPEPGHGPTGRDCVG